MINKLASAVLVLVFVNLPGVIEVLAGQADTRDSAKIAAGKLRAEQVCANCHGLDGQAGAGGNSALSPNLTAQQKLYLVAKLEDYRSGKIQHPQMTLVAKMLTDEDIDNVSDWYSSFRIDSTGFIEQTSATTGVEQSLDDRLSAPARAGMRKAMQTCANCHGLYGRALSAGNSAIIPNLTAQQKEYLVNRLKDYRSARIEHPQMSLVAKMLTDEDIDNVSAWYSQIEITVFAPDQ